MCMDELLERKGKKRSVLILCLDEATLMKLRRFITAKRASAS